MRTDIAISAENLGKCYQIYAQPIDRLKQSFWRRRKKFFKEFWALRNATFEIRVGETIGIIGSNGSGKSTLLQLICGIVSPTTGDIRINGRIAAMLELGAGFNPEFSGRENVLINAAIMGLSREEIDECYEDILAFADIGDFISQPVKTYSSGMYVRLAFATAINVSPDILVVDEALSVGDIRFKQKCMARIKAFCERGTVIFVSHDTGAVTELCSRAIWIEGGEIRMDGPPKPVIENYLQYMYEGDADDAYDACTLPEAVAEVTPIGDAESLMAVGPDLHQFGNRSATIEKVQLLSNGGFKGIVYSSKPCEIKLILKAHQNVVHPIVGFFVKDRLGREIIGESTFLLGKNPPPLMRNRTYCFSFKMAQWPNLREDDYVLSVAVADGTMEAHQQCHLVHDVIAFKSLPTRKAAGIFTVLDTDVNYSEVWA